MSTSSLRFATLSLWGASLAILGLTGCGSSKVEPTTPASNPISLSDIAKPKQETGSRLFEDVTKTSGVSHSYRNGEEVSPPHLSILESLGGGLGVVDFDGDGLLDLFVVGGGKFGGKDNKEIQGQPCKLYRNLGDFKFADVTEKVGLGTLADGKPWFYTHGIAVGDYDCDGWPDLLVTGWGRVALFHNVPDGKGGRKFEDVTKASGLDKGVTWTTSAAWADFDGDGFPDLYICQYVNWSFENHPDCNYDGKTPDVCPPKKFKGLRHLVFRNRGNGTFENVSDKCGLHPGGDDASKGLGCLAVDVNGDGKPDIYAANDTVNNFLYINTSKKGEISFVEKGMTAGVAADGFGSPNGSMGTDAGDPEGTGKPMIFCTNYENELHALYRNLSTKDRVFFVYVTPSSGMAAFGQKFVGWGTSFVDFDRDGWEDLVIVNGHAIRYPTTASRKQKPLLLRNSGGGKFLVCSERGGDYFQNEHLSRGLALCDFNNDGRVDFAVANCNEPCAIMKNVSDDKNHWLGMSLERLNHHDLVGTRVQVFSGGRVQTRFCKGGGSYASSPDRRFLIGLGAESKVDKVVVEWCDGTKQEFTNVPVDGYVRITQGEMDVKPLTTRQP